MKNELTLYNTIHDYTQNTGSNINMYDCISSKFVLTHIPCEKQGRKVNVRFLPISKNFSKKKIMVQRFILQASPTSKADTGTDHSLLHHMHAATVLQNSKRICKRL